MKNSKYRFLVVLVLDIIVMYYYTVVLEVVQHSLQFTSIECLFTLLCGSSWGFSLFSCCLGSFSYPNWGGFSVVTCTYCRALWDKYMTLDYKSKIDLKPDLFVPFLLISTKYWIIQQLFGLIFNSYQMFRFLQVFHSCGQEVFLFLRVTSSLMSSLLRKEGS